MYKILKQYDLTESTVVKPCTITGDIYRWSWNEVTLKKLENEKHSGTLYWCCSRICVFKDDKQYWDTYWGGSYNNDKRFSIDDAKEKLELDYLGNFSELQEANKSERAYYEDSDCVYISHANSSRAGFYIRKGAVKSLDKMKRVSMRKLKRLQSIVRSASSDVIILKKEIDSLDIDSHIYCSDVSLNDSSYEDKELNDE